MDVSETWLRYSSKDWSYWDIKILIVSIYKISQKTVSKAKSWFFRFFLQTSFCWPYFIWNIYQVSYNQSLQFWTFSISTQNQVSVVPIDLIHGAFDQIICLSLILDKNAPLQENPQFQCLYEFVQIIRPQ